MRKKQKSNRIWYLVLTVIFFLAAGWYILFDAKEYHIKCNIDEFKENPKTDNSKELKKDNKLKDTTKIAKSKSNEKEDKHSGKCEIASSTLIKKDAVVLPAIEVKNVISQRYFPRDKDGNRLEIERYRIFIETEKNGIINFGSRLQSL